MLFAVSIGKIWSVISDHLVALLKVEHELTHAQLTRPHSPPAVTTAKGVVGEFPRAFAKSCFALSYVIK